MNRLRGLEMKRLLVTDSVPLTALPGLPVKRVSVAGVLAEEIRSLTTLLRPVALTRQDHSAMRNTEAPFVSARPPADQEVLRLTTLGVGAMASPRYAPAGLLVEGGGRHVMIDGGKGAEPAGELEAWLVTDEHAELMPELRRLAAARGLKPTAGEFEGGGLRIRPRQVQHTNHPAFGYEITFGRSRVVWAPEFWTFPDWAAGADLAFLEAAAWARPIRFRGGVGGHAPVQRTAQEAQEAGIRRVVFVHIGRPTIRAMDSGEAQGMEFAADGQVFEVGVHREA